MRPKRCRTVSLKHGCFSKSKGIVWAAKNAKEREGKKKIRTSPFTVSQFLIFSMSFLRVPWRSSRQKILHVKIADSRRFLALLNERIGDTVKQLLCAPVAEVQNTRPANTVVNREAHPDKRDPKLFGN